MIHNETQSMGLGFGWFWYAKCFLFNIKFAHICSLTALERYLPKKFKITANPANLTTTKQPVKNHGASNAFLSEPVNISLTSLSSGCVLILPLCPFFAYHPHQTPSLGPFIPDAVLLQIQIRQSRVLFEAFGQGLKGEIWTLSAALELIKL